MPALPHTSTGDLVTAAMWNDIVDDLNLLTGTIHVAAGYVGVGILAPTRQVHVYGLGQVVSTLTDAGNKGGTLYLQDSGTATGNGGALTFGAGQGLFGTVKGLLTNGTDNTTGNLAISLRNAVGDTSLTEIMRVNSDGAVFINAVSNSFMNAGLTINQGPNDTEILSLKSSGDVSHSFTAFSEASTYAMFKKESAANGGLQMMGLSDSGGATSLSFYAWAGAVDATKSTAAVGAVMITGGITDGSTGAGGMTANSNLLVVRDASNARFILDSDGDSHLDGSGWATYDSLDDVATLNLLTAYVTRADDPLKASFGQWLAQSREPLERLKLASFDAQGRPFVNMSKLLMLVTGAVRQVGGRLEALERRAIGGADAS